MGRTPEEAMARYTGLSFINYGSSTSFSYTLMEALKSIYRTYKLGLFSFDAQRLSDYEKYRDSKEGAITMLIPGKLVVFEWLKGEVSVDLKKFLAMSINKYSKALSHFNVTELVRILVEEEIDEYDIGTFKKYGFRHSFLTFYEEPSFVLFTKNAGIFPKSDSHPGEGGNLCDMQSGRFRPFCVGGMRLPNQEVRTKAPRGDSMDEDDDTGLSHTQADGSL